MAPVYQKITLDIRIQGSKIADPISVSTTAGFDQINLTASVTDVTLPSGVAEGNSLEIWASNGTYSGHIFSGEIDKVSRSYAATKGTISGRDLLARTRYEWGGEDQEETEIDSAAAVRHYLEIMGIPSSAASIEGTDWTLGVVDPLTIKNGDVVYSKIEQIDYFEGYRTYSLPAGTIVRRRVSAVSGSGIAMTFEKGVQILADASWERGLDGISNKVIIEGVSYEGLDVSSENVGDVQAANPYVPNPPGFVTLKEQTDLIEDDDRAYTFAKRFLLDKNRRPELIRFRVPFDPRPQPGMLASVIHADLVGGTSKGLIMSVAHDISNSGAFTSLVLTGGALSLPVNKAPVAVFDYQLFREGEDTGSGVDAFYLSFCDGTLSYDPDGTIASYAWTVAATGGTATPTSGSGVTFTFVLTGDVTSIVLTLTVTDNDGLTGELARTIPISAALTLVENKYLAFGTAAVSVDGEQTWIDATPASGNATCLMPIAPVWGQVWGTDTGHLYATFDNLTTSLVDLGAPHGAVACTAVWVHETDSTRLWAGFSDGKVYFGDIDTSGYTATFTLQGTIPEGPIVELRESYGLLGELRATAGTSYYYSADSGATWTSQHTFDTAWRMAAGFDANLASGLNDAAPLYREETTAPTVPGGIEHIRGLSFGWRDQELYAADDAANLYISTNPSTTFNLALSADTTSAIVNHLIRSGNERRAVYMAVGDGTGDNGFVKWLPDVLAPLYFRRTGTDQGYMVGYGAAHLPPVKVDLLMIKTGASNAPTVYYYEHRTAAWTTKTGDLPNGTQAWSGIVAAPLDPQNEWIAWTLREAYRTTNAGTNWTQLTGIGDYAQTQATDPTPTLTIREIEFSPTVAHRWIAVGDLIGFPRTDSVVSLGDGDAMTTEASWMVRNLFTNGDAGAPRSIAWLVGTQFVVYTHRFDGASITEGSAWLQFDTATLTGGSEGVSTGSSNSPPLRIVDALATTGQIAGVANEAIAPVGFSHGYDIGDVYTSQSITQAIQLIGTGGGSVRSSGAITADGIYTGDANGVTKYSYTNPTTGVVVAHAGAAIEFIRAEHTVRTGIAALVSSSGVKVAVSDGVSWVDVAAPVGVTIGSSSNIGNWVEVIAAIP